MILVSLHLPVYIISLLTLVFQSPKPESDVLVLTLLVFFCSQIIILLDWISGLPTQSSYSGFSDISFFFNPILLKSYFGVWLQLWSIITLPGLAWRLPWGFLAGALSFEDFLVYVSYKCIIIILS